MRFIHLDTVASTQDEARTHLADGERGPLWIRAERQTAGRGRKNRRWTSERGNLSATLIWPTTAPPTQSALAGFAVSLAIADTLKVYKPRNPVTLKWPNDVLVGGRKISGILIEREPQTLLIGVGLNLVSHPDDTAYPATHLVSEMHESNLLGPEPLFTGVSATLAVLADRVKHRLVSLETDGFGPTREAWLKQAEHLGRSVTVDGKSGTFLDLGQDGALCLRMQDGTKTYVYVGDVSFG